MYRQVLDPVMDPDTGLMQRGMIVRHLLLPGQAKDSKKILRYLHETYGDHIYISIMNQYTPLPQVADIEALNHTVTPEEYDRVLRFAERIGIDRASGKREVPPVKALFRNLTSGDCDSLTVPLRSDNIRNPLPMPVLWFLQNFQSQTFWLPVFLFHKITRTPM